VEATLEVDARGVDDAPSNARAKSASFGKPSARPRRRRLAHKPRPRVPDNLTLVCLPAYAPELNPAENIWDYLRKNKLAIRVYATYDAIVDACCRAWNDLLAIPARLASITTRDWATV
jgi:DDE superfamily endonuclease